MLVELEKINLNLLSKPVRASKIEWIEQEILVPDSMPDALKLVNVTSIPYVSNIEALDSKVKIDGKINYYIVYMTQDSNMPNRGLFVSSPYSVIIPVEGASKDMIASVVPAPRNVIYSLPNERKIMSKTEVMFKIYLTKIEKLDIVQRIKNLEDMQIKNKECMLNNITGNKYSIIASREDIMMPDDIKDFYEILKAIPRITETEYKQSYNKIMVKGEMVIDVTYLTNLGMVRKMLLSLPFSGVIELDNITDSSKFKITYNIMDFLIKPNNNGNDTDSIKAFEVDYKIGCNALMYEETSVNLIDDFYSENMTLKEEFTRHTVVISEDGNVKYIDIKENMPSIVKDGYKLVEYNINLEYVNISVLSENINVAGNIKVNLLFEDESSKTLEIKSEDIILDENIPIESLEGKDIAICLAADKISVTQEQNNVDVRIRLNIKEKLENVTDLDCITSIDAGDFDISTLDSMYIYIVKPQDTLWSIAKKYKTTVEKIVKTNDIENPSLINVGQKLLIIR